MSEFLYLYRGGDSSGTPEMMQQSMQKWTAWLQDLGAKGHIKDQGNPLEATGKVVKKKTAITDGPYAESKELLGGFAVLEFASRDAAIEGTRRFLQVAGDGECVTYQIMQGPHDGA